ncbi:MAG: site-specific DNA-methyltransferase [Pseudoxanthomonas suwonensis]|nr:site-specific DNA-methyltransferase [Pseudoxanthomonas suwonensis]
MMYPRLKLARNLLADHGAIMVHMDENEHSNLEKLLNEVFGEENNLGTIVWDKRNPKGDSTGVSQQHELICVYCRDREAFKRSGEFLRSKENAERMLLKASQIVGREGGVTEKARREYREWVKQQDLSGGEAAYNQIDAQGDVFRPVSMAWPNKKRAPDDYFVPLIHPISKRPCPVPERGWRNPSETMQELLKAGQILFGADEATQPTRKYLLKDNLFENVPSLLYFGGSDDALLAEMGIPFDTPKPVYVTKRLVQSACRGDGIVLDFFAGSGTTGHATMSQNAADGGSRRYILVQIPEPLDIEDTDQKVPANFCDQLGKPRNISELTKERLRRAASKVKADNPEWTGDAGFRVYKLDQSNIRAWQPSGDIEQDLLDNVEHIVPDRSEQDVLTELLLKLGLDLCVPIEQRQIAGKTVHAIGAGVLMACLDPRIGKEDAEPLALGMAGWHKELDPAGDTTCVFRDSAFENDEAKTNLAAILEQHGIRNVRSL